MALKLLLVGGYGVFGGRLLRLLRGHANLDLLVAGRTLTKAEAFCAAHGGRPQKFDREGDLAAQLAAIEPHVVIDAAGPFQHYGTDPYRLARAALAAGAHYLDLADDAAFVSGIEVLNQTAKQAGLTALSGVSSVPAVSSAAVEQLRVGCVRIECIDTVILPGNGAPRGLSVVRAVVSQAGRNQQVWRDGAWQSQTAWGDLSRVQLSAGGQRLSARWASPIGAPDLRLFPSHYGARTVEFRAGLELGVLHLGLWLLAWLPRLGLMTSLDVLASLLRRLADYLLPFGEDRGGMMVTVLGETSSGQLERRCWTLLAESGDGPFIPVVAAAAWLRQLADGVVPAPGARPCIGELALPLLMAEMASLAVVTESRMQPSQSLFERALGEDWARLPAPVRKLHAALHSTGYRGVASVQTGGHPFARLARLLMRLPSAIPETPVRVRIVPRGDREHWRRDFGQCRFVSVLSWQPRKQRLTETFSLLGLPMRFELGLVVSANALYWPVTRGWFCGVPLPRALLPISNAREEVDERGRFRFDVEIRLRRFGLVAHYRGWLEAEAP